MGKRVILFTLLVVFAIRCQDKAPSIENQELNLKEIQKSLDRFKSEETFSLNSEEGIEIECKKGTKIIIDKNSFVDSQGNEVSGKVEFKVKEVIALEEILAENISTVTKNGILETRGMLNIRAEQNGNQLLLKKSKKIKILLPKGTKEEKNMKLYYGVKTENGLVEWKESNEQNKIATKEEFLLKKDIQIRYNLHEDMEIRDAGLRNNVQGEKLIEELLSFTDAEKAKLLKKPIYVHWILFADGDLEIYGVSGDISKRRKEEIERKLSDTKFIKPFKREGDVADIKGTISIGYKKIKNTDVDKYYDLVSSRLGWLNCDMFIQFEAAKIKMLVDVPEGSVVKLLFKNYFTIVTGFRIDDKYMFYNIPKGEPIDVIIINRENSRLNYSRTASIVKSNIDRLNPLKEVTFDELKMELSSLN